MIGSERRGEDQRLQFVALRYRGSVDCKPDRGVGLAMLERLPDRMQLLHRDDPRHGTRHVARPRATRMVQQSERQIFHVSRLCPSHLFPCNIPIILGYNLVTQPFSWVAEPLGVTFGCGYVFIITCLAGALLLMPSRFMKRHPGAKHQVGGWVGLLFTLIGVAGFIWISWVLAPSLRHPPHYCLAGTHCTDRGGARISLSNATTCPSGRMEAHAVAIRPWHVSDGLGIRWE